ncbi:PH domain-containing protein DDB_G0275795-like isoform X2 [Venturia canescens]|uniref:PH domain-containing protein DDB_G0275795-like isoform X2 n=1 Tax=Venturia canescens TaxID=32260 RepID=UPI001C9C0C88|nr:PH domain-containing protein DDB_G0275795-like isoform X2 [Venturia canescens]
MRMKSVNRGETETPPKRSFGVTISDEENSYKSVPAPKPVPNNQRNNCQRNNESSSGRAQPIGDSIVYANSTRHGQLEYEDRTHDSGLSATGPEYRMPPLYGEEQTSNQNQSTTHLQTHSNKFPIEREVVLSSTDKNSKIPILHEYKQRGAGRVAIAPDAPIKQQAWVQEGNQMQDQRHETNSRNFQSQETYSSSSTGAVPRTGKNDEEKTKSLSRTYHTIKDMISSRFGPGRKDVDPEPEVSLNNVTEELRKSSRSINEEEAKKKESIYGKPRAQDPPVINMQQYSKNSYGQYGQAYGYQSPQQNVPLPGQLQTSSQALQPSLPGQSAQLHVTHITPPGGVQTVHQTQVTNFGQSGPGGQQMQSTNREYLVQASGGIGSQSMHQNMHQSAVTNQSQNPPVNKHGLPMQPANLPPPNSLQQTNSQSYQSPQQLIHQNQMHQSPRFSQQHVQNMHQRQLIQQMQQQQQQLGVGQQSPQTAMRTNQQQSHFPIGVTYQQYQQARQPISRSQIDLPSTSRQNLDVRIGGQEIYYHYTQNRSRYAGGPQVYMKTDANNQESEFQRRNSAKCIEKAASQPQLCYDDEKNGDSRRTLENEDVLKNIQVDSMSKERYEITVEERPPEFGRKGSQSQHNEDVRPETSFGIRRDEARSSKRDLSAGEYIQAEGAPETKDLNGVQRKIEEIQKRNDHESSYGQKIAKESNELDNSRVLGQKNLGQVNEAAKKIEESARRLENTAFQERNGPAKIDTRKDDLEHGMSRLKLQNQGSGSDYDKAGQSSSNVDSGRGSAVYSSGRRPAPEDQSHPPGQDSEWVDIVESELRSILEPRDVPAMAHSTLSESVSSVTPPLPPLSPHGSPRTSRNRYSASLPYGSKPNYSEYVKNGDKRNFPNVSKHRGSSTSKKDAAKKFSHLFGVEAGDLTSTTTGLDLDSMLDRSDSDLSTNDARTIRKQLEGLENMYSEVLKLLGGSVKKRRKARGLASYGSVSSLPTSSVSSRPVARHHDKRRSHVIDDRMKKAKDVKSINKRFQRLESHVVTLARSVAHLSSEMRTQHLMIQEMENIRGEIAALRTQTSMAMVRSQSQPLIKDSELPALSNPSRVKKLTKFFGTEPPLIRLFLRELGYEKYATAFEKEKVGMVELPYLSEERLQKMGVPLGPRLRILQEARISVCKDPVYVV